MDAVTTLSVPAAHAGRLTAHLIEAGVAFGAQPTFKGQNWSFAVAREDDDVLARFGASI